MTETEIETPEAEVVEPVEPIEDGDEPNEPVEPVEPVEPETDDPEADALSDKEIEAMQKKLDKEATRHANAVSSIMGDEAQDLSPCPLCPDNLPGFIFADHLPDEHRAAVAAFLTGASANDLVDDPETVRCEYCRGRGETSTGSLVPAQATRICPVCKANGWITVQEQRTMESTRQTAAVVQELQAQPPPEITSAGVPAFDRWNRPVGAEFYGRDPAYMTADEKTRDWPAAHAA